MSEQISVSRDTLVHILDALESLAEAVCCSQRLYSDRGGYLNDVMDSIAAIRRAALADGGQRSE